MKAGKLAKLPLFTLHTLHGFSGVLVRNDGCKSSEGKNCQKRVKLPFTILHRIAIAGWKKWGSIRNLPFPEDHTTVPQGRRACYHDALIDDVLYGYIIWLC